MRGKWALPARRAGRRNDLPPAGKVSACGRGLAVAPVAQSVYALCPMQRILKVAGYGVAVVSSVVALLSVRAAETRTTASEATTTLMALRAQLEAHVGDDRFSGATWGVKVVSLETGRTLFEHHADRLLSPASNTKLYTGALALDRLGGDYRIVTPILAAARPDASGTVTGDVIVSGRGDPGWHSWPERKGFEEIFAPFVAALRKAGVRRITGDLVADATFFRGGANGAGWTADDLNDYYGAEISALSLEDNYVDLKIVPGANVGRPAGVTLVQPHSGLVLDNRVVTSAAGGVRRIEVMRLLGESVVHVFGEMPLGNDDYITEATVQRPANWFAAALRDVLTRQGIVVEGKPRSVHWPDAAANTRDEARLTLGEIVSAPMREMVTGFMKSSQNLRTDLIFAHVGEMRRAADAPAWRSSEQCGVLALREFLQEHGLAADEVRFEEGSGLSRNNLTSARATVALLTFMAAHREAEAFRASLPIAGVDGTLRRRMKGTPAEGNVRAKTGTLRWANSVSGYVSSAAGEELVFSAMLNRAVMPPGKNARDEVDAIAVMLARFLGRSDAEVEAGGGGGDVAGGQGGR